MTVRIARAADVAAILDLWARARSPAATTPDGAGAVATLMARDPEALLVAGAEGEIAGVLIAAWDGWRGGLYRLAVDPERRRRGIATDLVEAGERGLRDLGPPR